MTKRVQDEVRFWESFIEHWERVHDGPAPSRAYDALSFARLRLKCMSEAVAPGSRDDTSTVTKH